jgi:hypothetical protein
MIRVKMAVLAGFISSALFVTAAQAKTVNAASCSQSDVQVAINSASSGDTVTVPGGSCTWNSVVSISSAKQIKLDGGGATITWGNNGGLSIDPGTTANTLVTGFAFDGSFTNGNCPIGISTSTSPLTETFRFYNNTLDGGNPGAPGTFICVNGNGPGLFDHNSFTTHNGADEMIHMLGLGPDNPSGWTDVVPPGGPNMIFLEDNSFTCTSSTLASAWESYYGARVVGRHNTFNNAQTDAHGGGGIGTRWWEIYNNTFVGTGICLRAGSGVVFSNSNADNIFMLQENGTYPANYQIGRGQNETLDPAYVWGNGSTPLRLNTTGCAPPEANMVQLNRDVYVASTGTALPGTCTVNQGFFKTDESTLYKCTSTNTWTTYYTPYPYPHPLTIDTATPPSNVLATPH